MGRTAHRNLIDLSAREGRIVAAIKANVPRVTVKKAHGIRAAYDRLEARAEKRADLQIARARARLEEFHAGTEASDGGGIGLGGREADSGG